MAALSTDAAAAAGAIPEGSADEEEYEEGEDDEEYDEEDDEEADETDPFDEALTEYFTELDAAAEAAAVVETAAPLPVKVSGISGNIAGIVYRQGLADKNLYYIYEDLLDLQTVFETAPECISRFFQHNNYSPEECGLAVNLLLSEHIEEYEEIANTELAEVTVGGAENFPSWLEAREAIAALNLEETSKDVLGELASTARLDLFPHVLSNLGLLVAAEAKVFPVTVSSAVPLSEDQKKRILALLPKYSGTASLDVTFEVEPSTLGGLLITLGNRSIDLTASSQLLETMQEYQ